MDRVDADPADDLREDALPREDALRDDARRDTPARADALPADLPREVPLRADAPPRDLVLREAVLPLLALRDMALRDEFPRADALDAFLLFAGDERFLAGDDFEVDLPVLLRAIAGSFVLGFLRPSGRSLPP